MIDFDLSGRVAVVTGAGGRLGPVWTRALRSAGCRVGAIDRPGQPEPAGLDEGTLLVRADVTDRPALEAARDRIVAALGPPTILVNNAGVDQPPAAGGKTHRLEDVPLAAGRAILAVNLLGLFQVCQVFLDPMRSAGGGSIVNIGSIYGRVSPDPALYDHLGVDPPFLEPPLYGASKAGVAGLTRYLAVHLGPSGIRVNTLSPGGIHGDQDSVFRARFERRVPLGRMGRPDDLAGPLLFLAGGASAYVTGIELVVDGGFTAW